MSALPTESPDSPDANQPDTLATPEGDNEYLPHQPLPSDEPTPERPRGDDPHSVEPLYPALAE
jgi:hypothetical protein